MPLHPLFQGWVGLSFPSGQAFLDFYLFRPRLITRAERVRLLIRVFNTVEVALTTEATGVDNQIIDYHHRSDGSLATA